MSDLKRFLMGIEEDLLAKRSKEDAVGVPAHLKDLHKWLNGLATPEVSEAFRLIEEPLRKTEKSQSAGYFAEGFEYFP